MDRWNELARLSVSTCRGMPASSESWERVCKVRLLARLRPEGYAGD